MAKSKKNSVPAVESVPAVDTVPAALATVPAVESPAVPAVESPAVPAGDTVPAVDGSGDTVPAGDTVPSGPERIITDGRNIAANGGNMDVDFALLYAEGNPRSEDGYKLPLIQASLKRHGFKRNHPVVLSAKADGRFLVLCGNRRFRGLSAIAAESPADFASILPSGKIPAVVHYNLTQEQEAILRVDHSKDEDRIPLDEFGEFLAIKLLVRSGYDSEAGLAEKLGKFHTSGKNIGKPNRSWVQPRVALAQLPDAVQDEFRKLWCIGPDATPLRVPDILKLYKVHNEEYRHFPSGNGPQFSAMLAEKLGAQPAAKVEKSTITPSEALKRSKNAGSAIMRETLKIVAGEPANNPASGQPFTLTDCDNAMMAAEAAQATLAEIASMLGENDYRQLIADAQQAAKQAASEAATVPAGDTVPAVDPDSNGTESNLTQRELQEITA